MALFEIEAGEISQSLDPYLLGSFVLHSVKACIDQRVKTKSPGKQNPNI